MNDYELTTAVKESVTNVHMNIPVERIVSRSRAVRTRRLIPGGAGALAVAAVAALAVTTLAPASHQPTARLTAWTVIKQADGDISVTINQFKDPAGLQSTLRADGVPASVTFTGQRNKACRPYPGGRPRGIAPTPPLLKHVFPKPYRGLPGNLTAGSGHAPSAGATGSNTVPLSGNSAVIVIDPSALPRNAGVQLASTGPSASAVLMPVVVYASTRCTGS